MDARMRSHALLALVAVFVVSACSDSNRGSNLPSSSDEGVESAHASRQALVYAAVIRRLVTKDDGFGGAPSPYRYIYVLDGVVPTAADPMHLVDRPAKPFAEGLGPEITAALRQLPPVTLVGSRRLAITGAEPGHVVHRGVLITLGRIDWVDAQTARVANNRWASGDNGQWLTYTVKYDRSSWRVTGVSGNKVALS